MLTQLTVVKPSAASPEPPALQALLLHRGPMPSETAFENIDIAALDSYIKEFYRQIPGLKEDPDTARDPSIAATDQAAERAWKDFERRFLQIKKSGDPLNEKNTRVYILGGSMEYMYFQARIAGLAGFMTKDQFRFLAVSRASYVGGYQEADQIRRYIELQLRDDLRNGKEIVLIDSVSSGESMRSTYLLVEETRRKMNSSSRITSFGIQEYGEARYNSGVGGNGSIFGAAITPDDYRQDMKEYGWAYYDFYRSKQKEKSPIEFAQAVPRFAAGKFTNELKNDFPVTISELSDSLREKLMRHSVQELITSRQLDTSESLYLFSRLRSIRFYTKASQRHIQQQRTCNRVLLGF